MCSTITIRDIVIPETTFADSSQLTTKSMTMSFLCLCLFYFIYRNNFRLIHLLARKTGQLLSLLSSIPQRTWRSQKFTWRSKRHLSFSLASKHCLCYFTSWSQKVSSPPWRTMRSPIWAALNRMPGTLRTALSANGTSFCQPVNARVAILRILWLLLLETSLVTATNLSPSPWIIHHQDPSLTRHSTCLFFPLAVCTGMKQRNRGEATGVRYVWHSWVFLWRGLPTRNEWHEVLGLGINHQVRFDQSNNQNQEK